MMATMWDHLPEEMWLVIIEYLDAGSRRSFSVVNKYLRNAVKRVLSKTDHWTLITQPHKLTRTMWRALQSRRSVKLLLQDCKEGYDSRDSKFDLCLIVKQLSNISALDVTLEKFTLSEVKQLSTYTNLNVLKELNITFTKTRPDAIRSLTLLNATLVRLSLTGSIDCEKETSMGLEPLAIFTELTALCLDLQLLIATPEFMPYMFDWIGSLFGLHRTGSYELDLTENLGDQFRSLKKLRELSYSYRVNCLNTDFTLDLSPLEHLEQLSLKYATFMAVSRVYNFNSLVSLSLVDFQLADPCTRGSVFFSGLSHLKELTLKERPRDLQTCYVALQRELPSSLVSLTVHHMICTVGLRLYFGGYGKNLLYLELDAMKYFCSSTLVSSVPEMCPNLQALLFRHMYCDAEMIMKFCEIKNLQLLEVYECRGCEDVDMSQLAETIRNKTKNRIRLFLGIKSNLPRKYFLSNKEWDHLSTRPSKDYSHLKNCPYCAFCKQ